MLPGIIAECGVATISRITPGDDTAIGPERYTVMNEIDYWLETRIRCLTNIIRAIRRSGPAINPIISNGFFENILG